VFVVLVDARSILHCFVSDVVEYLYSVSAVQVSIQDERVGVVVIPYRSSLASIKILYACKSAFAEDCRTSAAAAGKYFTTGTSARFSYSCEELAAKNVLKFVLHGFWFR